MYLEIRVFPKDEKDSEGKSIPNLFGAEFRTAGQIKHEVEMRSAKTSLTTNPEGVQIFRVEIDQNHLTGKD